MIPISTEDVTSRLALDNPWWQGNAIPNYNFPKRDYFKKLYPLVLERNIRRAVVLMGPRRVGKTVIIHQIIAELIEKQKSLASRILFVSMDTPLYVGLSLEKIVRLFFERSNLDEQSECFVFFDEIQYLKDWEIHLKDLVDRYIKVKFIVSGSAAAALRLQSQESGAGRFTDFMLPPLTFAEFIQFSKQEHLIEKHATDPREDKATSIDDLNKAFVDYLNFGGYPEIVINKDARSASKRLVKHDIIDKVLLRDLPSLYGINNIQELNQLFTMLAYNTSQEISLDSLSKSSNVNKSLLTKYLDYLEAAFLIERVYRVDQNSKQFKRQRLFKVYLTNPSMRAALFGPVKIEDDTTMGSLTESAIFSQWFHSPDIDKIYYARWKSGEVDLVKLNSKFEPLWAYEIKWSDRFFEDPRKLKGLYNFAGNNKLKTVGCTTKTKTGLKEIAKGIEIKFSPSSLHCYQVGRRVTKAQ